MVLFISHTAKIYYFLLTVLFFIQIKDIFSLVIRKVKKTEVPLAKSEQ